MERRKAKLQELESILGNDTIDLKKLREICSQGCPNEGGTRSLVWKILLNYLPKNRSQWTDNLNKRHAEYKEFIREMIIRPGFESNKKEEITDHPLNSGPTSEWDSYFKDNQVLVQIDKDVRRLCPDLFFFQKSSEFPCEIINEFKDIENTEKYQSLRERVNNAQLEADNISRNRMGITNIKNVSKKPQIDPSDEYAHLDNGQEAHWEIVQRILFIFAKLNPGNSYVQGMNEICGPIYYTFANDPDIEWRKNAEADCFYCFSNLMGLEGVRENFVASLDDSPWGIGSNMKRLYQYLKVKDLPVYTILEKQSLKPEFFAFRWLTLLLSQEFPLPDVIAVWDALFADTKTFDFLMHICCSMIMLQRNSILAGDFSHNIKILQNYPPIDIQIIINHAINLRQNNTK